MYTRVKIIQDIVLSLFQKNIYRGHNLLISKGVTIFILFEKNISKKSSEKV